MSSDSQAMGRVGEVIIRTWQTAHKMKVQRGALGAGHRAQRQLPRQALHREVHDQPGDHARHRARGRLDRGGQARRPRAVEAGVLRRQAVADPEGRHDRRGADGRPERVDPDAAAGALPADVRRVRRRARTSVTFVSQAALDEPALAKLGLRKPLVAVQNTRKIGKKRHDAQRRTCRRSSRSRDLRGARRRRAAHLRAGEACCRWRSATSCSERDDAC